MSVEAKLHELSEHLPKDAGPVALLSGDEFLPPVREFDRRLLELTGARVGVVYCADHRAQPQSERFARKHFEGLQAQAFPVDMHGDNLPEFDLLYIAGGSPKDLLEHLRASELWPRALERWKTGAGLAGSSAGAMVLCANMVTPAPGARVPTVWVEGAGPLERIALAVHASSRTTAWLEEIARTAPVPVLALGDRTGVILKHGRTAEIIGDERVWLL